MCGWPEQRDYELIRPMVLFGSPATERAAETCAASERTLQRRAARFEAEGMESLFASETARRRRLPPSMRRLIVDLKAEHPGLNPNEIAAICYVRFGRRPARKTVKRVLAEEPLPLRMMRRFPPYHQSPDPAERRRAVVALHAEGWSAKAIADYLRVGRSTVYRVLKRWAEKGAEGLEDGPHGRPPGVRKVDLKAMAAIRRLQENPNLGEFRMHAALAQLGIHLSPRFMHWRLYGEEALAGREAALWLAAESLTLEHEGEALARYDVEVAAGTGGLRAVGRPRLFETTRQRNWPQPRLFGLDSLGQGGWLKALRLEGYAPRAPRRPQALQQALFPCAEAL